MLTLIGLADSGAKYPGQLSGGQQQRIALARALATSPGCCCSTNRFRRSTRRCACACEAKSASLQQRLGVTTILVTHDQEEALSIADRVVVMNQGRDRADRHAEQVYREPASPFVADFVGKTNILARNVCAINRELDIGDSG